MSDLSQLHEQALAAQLEFAAAQAAKSPRANELRQLFLQLSSEYRAEQQRTDYKQSLSESHEHPSDAPIVWVEDLSDNIEGLGPLYFAQRFVEAGGEGVFTEQDLRDILSKDMWATVRWASPELPFSAMARVNESIASLEIIHEVAAPSTVDEELDETAPREVIEAEPALPRSGHKDIPQEVTDKIIAQLEAGVVPWHKHWYATGGQLPLSMSSGKTYKGMNSMLLGMAAMTEGYSSPYWGTFKHIKDLGGAVKKGEHGEMVIIYKTTGKEEKDQTKADGAAPETGEKTPNRKSRFVSSYTVFNASQCTGLPDLYTAIAPDPRNEHERIGEAEAAVATYIENDGPTLRHGGNRAFFRPSADLVVMPELDSFDSPEEYYSTLFHELTHSTGHTNRLAREGVVEGHQFGDALYSKEELIAELGAAMACASLGIDQAVTMPNSANYIANWLSQLHNDKTLIMKAAAGAQKAVEHIGLSMDREIAPDIEPTVAAEAEAIDVVMTTELSPVELPTVEEAIRVLDRQLAELRRGGEENIGEIEILKIHYDMLCGKTGDDEARSKLRESLSEDVVKEREREQIILAEFSQEREPALASDFGPAFSL